MKRFFIVCVLLLIYADAIAQITIQGFSVKSVLPSKVTEWPVGSVSAVAMSARKQGGEEAKMVITIKNGAGKMCGNNIQTASLGGVTTKAITTRDVTDNIDNCVLAPGQYNLCIEFFNADNNSVCKEQCRAFTVAETNFPGSTTNQNGNPSVPNTTSSGGVTNPVTTSQIPKAYRRPDQVMPANNTDFKSKDLKKPITFRWTPAINAPVTDLIYTLRVYKMLPGQKAGQAVLANSPEYEKEVKTTQAMWLMPAEYTSGKEEQTFVWNVQATTKEGKGYGDNNGLTDNWIFRSIVSPPQAQSVDSVIVRDSVYCAQGMYTLKPNAITNNTGLNIVSWTISSSNSTLMNGSTPLAYGVPLAGNPAVITAGNTITGWNSIFTNPISSPVIFTYTFTLANGSTIQVVTQLDYPICDSCVCNNPATISYDYYPSSGTGTQSLNVSCGSSIHINAGDKIFPRSGCSGANCQCGIRGDLYDITQGVSVYTNIDAGSIYEMGFLYPCDSYRLVLRSTCTRNGIVTNCPPCTLYVKVDCPPPVCECNNNWGNINYILASGSQAVAHCGDTVSINQGTGILNVQGNYSCGSTVVGCKSDTNYRIFGPDNFSNVYIAPTPGFAFAFPYNAPCGVYKVVFKVKCNGVQCANCVWYIKVACASCSCIPSDTIRYNLPNGTPMIAHCNDTLNVNQYSSGLNNIRWKYGCLPDSCTKSDTSCKVYKLPSGILFMSSSSLSVSFPNDAPCGLYKVVFKGRCGGVLCDSCTLYIRVNCPPSCHCLLPDTVRYNLPNGTEMIAHCRDTVTVNQGTGLTNLRWSYSCSPTSCIKSDTSCTVYNAVGNVVLSANALSIQIIPTLPCGLYRAVFKGRCGSILCDSCTLFIKVLCIQPPTTCDSFWASTTSDTGSCCWKLNLHHPSSTTGIKYVRLTALSPNTFAGTPSLAPGWVPYSGTSTVKKIGVPFGSVPTGQLNNVMRFCMNSLANPQQIVVDWLKINDTLVCRDTLTLSCSIPCVTYTWDTVTCNGNNYQLVYQFHNNADFTISSIINTVVSPGGVTVTPATTTLSPVVAPNGTSGNITLTLNNATPGSTVCIAMKFRSNSSCCWCYDTLCVTIPPCACESINAELTGDSLNCCYNLSLTNNYAANYFTGINLTCLSTNVGFQSYTFNTDWGTSYVFPSNQAHIVHDNVYFPTGVFNVGNLCFTGYSTPPEYILVEWMRDSNVVCRDTIQTMCAHDPSDNGCAQIKNDTLICLSNGTFQYTFQVQNNDPTHTANGFQLHAISPNGMVITPYDFPVTIVPGGSSPTQTLIISGVNPNTLICFQLAIYDHVDSMYSWCCYGDTICMTTPPCGQNCHCGWSKIISKINGVSQMAKACGGTIQVNLNDVLYVRATMVCTPTSCVKSDTTYTIYAPNGSVYVPMTSGLSFTFPMSTGMQCGTYKAVFHGKCGGVECDSCVLYITVKCCECGVWKKIKYSVNSGTPQYKMCGGDINIGILDALTNIMASHAPCTPSGCPSNDSVFIYQQTNLIYSHAGLTIPTFPVSCGNFRIVFRQRCGNSICECVLNVHVDCCGDRQVQLSKTSPISWSSNPTNCLDSGLYMHRLSPGLPTGTTVNYTVSFLPAGGTTSGTYVFSGPYPTFTVPDFDCNHATLRITYAWSNGPGVDSCRDTLTAHTCETPCCDYIRLDTANLPTTTLSGVDLTFNLQFVLTPPATTFTKIKVQILHVSNAGVNAQNANIYTLDKLAPTVNGSANSAITGTSLLLQGDAMWFPTGFTTTTNPLKFKGEIKNLNSGATIGNTRLLIRFTFYRTLSGCLQTICEKDVQILGH